jgi:hypothetical protein
MTRSLQRIADQCRQRAADDRFLRRFGMAEPSATGSDDDVGPGWYESSRDLEAGLHVHEGGEACMAEWHEACRRFVPPRLAAPAAPAAAVR